MIRSILESHLRWRFLLDLVLWVHEVLSEVAAENKGQGSDTRHDESNDIAGLGVGQDVSLNNVVAVVAWSAHTNIAPSVDEQWS